MQTIYTHFAYISQKKDTARPLRGPDLKNCLQFVFSPWCAHGHDALYIGGPGTLSHFPQCFLPPIMCCRFYVYEGCALIACMCMQCKEARDFCLMPPPTEHAIAHRTYFCGNHDSVQENKNTKRNFVWIPQLELTNRSLGLRQCTACAVQRQSMRMQCYPSLKNK